MNPGDTENMEIVKRHSALPLRVSVVINSS
jgi:hypothetical protein